MIFRFDTFNHCPQGKIIVEDITAILGHQLMALGHEVAWGSDGGFAQDMYNVVLESFADDPATITRIADAHGRGCRFLIIATEEPTAAGFNHGLEPAMIDRQNAFPAAAKFADGILHLIPGKDITAWYRQFAPAAYAELGYAETLVQKAGSAKPEYDFGFYGKMTWRRQQMLGELNRAGHSVLRIATLDVPPRERDERMRNARVIVQIRANTEWGMVSSTRCASALYLGRPVVAEPHPIPGPWAGVVHFAEEGKFFDDAVAMLGDWQNEHARQLARFAKHLPPEHCIGRALQEIGINGRT